MITGPPGAFAVNGPGIDAAAPPPGHDNAEELYCTSTLRANE